MSIGLKRFYFFLVFIGTLVILLLNCTGGQKLAVTNLQCEYLENPLGIDMPHPRLSWTISSNLRGVSQSAYRILVADNRESLQDDTGNVWDSGKISSGQNGNVEYDGQQLESNQTYYWKVLIWNQDEEQSPWSKIATFHIGLLHESDWAAEWIAAGDTTLQAPTLRKDFEIDKQVESAYASVTGVGYYELYLNGEKVGDHVLDPGMTNYEKRILYATYDVTDQLSTGVNAVGMILGDGAYRMEQVEGRYSWGGGGNLFGAPRALLQLELTFSDGSNQRIITDGTWQSSSGPITFNHFYGGEDYDARLEKPGWSTADYDASGWDQVMVVEGPGGILDSQLMSPIKVTQTLRPVAQTNPEEGVYLYDFGQNFPGWWRIRVEGETGVELRIRGAETLNDSLFPEPLQPGDRLSTKHRYHSNVWTTYILNGDGVEIYEPRFFYTGFRYAEVTVNQPENLESLEVEGRVAHSALETNGRFVTSDSLLNRIHRATVWSQRGNTHSFPTDCPQREKGGYTGDGQVIAETSIHDFHMEAFYTKWLNDMKDAQQENGRIPNTSPTLVGGHGGGIAWGSAYILLPWWMYQYYDDTRIMEQHYPTMKRYLEYLRTLAQTDSNPGEPYIINDFGGYWDSLGEWCAPEQSDGPNHPVVNTFYYYWDTMTLSRIAEALGQTADANRYSDLADTIKAAFNTKFFNPETNLYGTEEPYQTYQLLALFGNAAPEDRRDEILQTIIDDIVITRQGHLNTGIIGTKHLWPVLLQSGYGDVAYTAATQTTFPSYGFWLENGATTLWEKWSGENSHNHQMFGSVDEFFYKYLAGIHAPTDGKSTKGYRQIHIQPYVPEGLTWVEASLETVAGSITSHWEQQSALFQQRVTIPPNTTGTISLPLLGFEDVVIQESGETVWVSGEYTSGVPGINNAQKEGAFVTFFVGSGNYEFVLTEG